MDLLNQGTIHSSPYGEDMDNLSAVAAASWHNPHLNLSQRAYRAHHRIGPIEPIGIQIRLDTY